MSANEKQDLKDLPEKDMKDQQAERVKGGVGPIDAKNPPIPKPKPFIPIDG
jgi:hypothetical protein